MGRTCCCCPTFEDTGLPESLVANFSISDSSDEGMPADEAIGNCAGGDIYLRFSFSDAIAALLSSITFDYVESGTTSCGGAVCCHLYEGRTDYTPTCPASQPAAILFGESPFQPRVIGEITSITTWVGNDLNDPEGSGCDAPCDVCVDKVGCPTTYIDCCGGPVVEDGMGGCTYQHSNPCSGCGTQYSVDNGVHYEMLNIYGSASLTICIQGNVVTICISVSLSGECRSRTGDATSNRYFGCDFDSDECSNFTDYTGSHSTACATNSTATITLSATADLSAVSGADIWKKIKNYSGWESEFDVVMCNCGPGGCTDDTERIDCACYFNVGCTCDPVDPDTLGTCNPTTGTDEPVDRDCLYSGGTMAFSLSDE